MSEEETTPVVSLEENNVEPTSVVSEFASKITLFTRTIKQGAAEKRFGKGVKLWTGVVNVGLLEARDLPPKPDSSLPDPFVKFRLGAEKYKSKVRQKTLNPFWGERFNLYLYEDRLCQLEILVKSDDLGTRETLLGECLVDLSQYLDEVTHHVEIPLQDNNGVIKLLLTITYTTEDNRSTLTKKAVKHEFSYLQTLQDLHRVGWLQVVVLRAQGLTTADIVGTSDPYCVVELDNNRIQTPTVYKSINPEWNKTFTMDIKDIHSVLEITVFDENKNKKVDFLGKVAIPLLQIKAGEKVWYQLKDANLIGRRKGAVQVQIEHVYNPIRAAVRTFSPKEKIHMKPEPKLKVVTMKNNIERSRRILKSFMDVAKFVQSCLNWDSKPRSILALTVYILCVLYFELYMLPLFVMFLLLKNLVVTNVVDSFKDSPTPESALEGDEEDDDFEAKEEKKSFVEKFQAIQDVCLTVQEILDTYASLFERIRNTFTWKVPWLTSLGLLLLFVVTVLLYFIPVRVMLLAFGIRKFSKKFLDPHYVDNNEVLDYFSRIPCDRELVQYRALQPDLALQAALRKADDKSKIVS